MAGWLRSYRRERREKCLKPQPCEQQSSAGCHLALTQVGFTQDICERFPQGSFVTEPENLYSTNGVLEVNFTYETREDDFGKFLYCFTNSDGAQSPTLHVNPGDTLIINLTNLVPEGTGQMPSMPGMDMSKAGEGGCGDLEMTSSSVNLHYHGTNTPPTCHQDEVIRTIINSGHTFATNFISRRTNHPDFIGIAHTFTGSLPLPSKAARVGR